VGACVRACVRAFVRACVRASVRACVRVGSGTCLSSRLISARLLTDARRGERRIAWHGSRRSTCATCNTQPRATLRQQQMTHGIPCKRCARARALGAFERASQDRWRAAWHRCAESLDRCVVLCRMRTSPLAVKSLVSSCCTSAVSLGIVLTSLPHHWATALPSRPPAPCRPNPKPSGAEAKAVPGVAGAARAH
jgi:hypothetical protein